MAEANCYQNTFYKIFHQGLNFTSILLHLSPSLSLLSPLCVSFFSMILLSEVYFLIFSSKRKTNYSGILMLEGTCLLASNMVPDAPVDIVIYQMLSLMYRKITWKAFS